MAINWPCGQNPGRKPEGRQHASTREAMSPGEQDSTCRASTSYAELATAASGTARKATRHAERVGVASNRAGFRKAFFHWDVRLGSPGPVTSPWD